jgi:universal stress protein E
LLDKAVPLARSLGAQIFLFSCDAALAKAIHHTHNSEDAEKARQLTLDEHLAYLRALRVAVHAGDVQISVDVGCASPLYEAIAQKAAEIRADLVMKSPSGSHPMRRFAFDSSDWHLMRECPATLMLVRHRRWQAIPTFAAMVNVAEESAARLAEAIIHTSEYFALGCRAELDVVYSESSADTREQSERLAALQRLTQEYRIRATHVHVLSGEPEVTLPDFAARHHYDALILGGLTHRRGIAPLMGTLTGKLVETLDTDFILVKRDVAAPAERRASDRILEASEANPSPDRTHPGNRASSVGSSVVWQALFGD